MTDTIESSNINNSRIGALSTESKARFVAFSFVVLALLGLNFVSTPSEVLTAPFVGWFENLGVHQVRDMTVAALIWLVLIVPLALLLYHPSGRVNTVLAPLIILIPHAVLAYLSDSFLFMPFVVMSALALLIFAFHPAGRSLVRFDRIASIDWRPAAVYVIGVVPLLVYAGFEITKQLGPVDEHVVFVHYGGMAIGVFFIAVMGALAIIRTRDWRFAGLSTGLVAAFIGLVSIGYPAGESSLGLIGGALLFLWAVTFVASVEYVRRDDTRDTEAIDETVAEAA